MPLSADDALEVIQAAIVGFVAESNHALPSMARESAAVSAASNSECRFRCSLLLYFLQFLRSSSFSCSRQIFEDTLMPPSADSADIGQLACERLCELLERLARQGISQQQVAVRAGIPPQYLSDIKNGRRPMTELVARRIGHEFQVNYEWLLGLSDTFEPIAVRGATQPESSGNWLPVFPHPITGNPQSHSKNDGTALQISGAAAAKLGLLKWPYILRFGADDHLNRLKRGDLILISQSSSDNAEIHVVECRRQLVLARRKSNGTWERLAKGERLPADTPVVGYCVGIVWSDLSC